jgi:FtsP/CotA-like multicopper oxidase with cupredoxin domain
VLGGLFGTLVVLPKQVDASVLDLRAVAHIYDGVRTLNGKEGDVPVTAAPGRHVRIRVVNTDNGPVEVWTSAEYRLVAVDGMDLHGPTPVSGKAVTVTAGGRTDLEVVMPADGSGVRVQVGESTALVLGRPGVDVPRVDQPTEDLDLLSYGTPAPLGFDPAKADRHFTYSLGRRPGFVKGHPGIWWSINGHLFPNVPMFVVHEGDVVRVHFENHSGDVHPMHLHGHHAVVLSRNGVLSTGSPWWFDSLNIIDGETYDVVFVADNPGIWMDHCHNLNHAAQGLVSHLMYEGVTEPYLVGGDSHNEPE